MKTALKMKTIPKIYCASTTTIVVLVMESIGKGDYPTSVHFIYLKTRD